MRRTRLLAAGAVLAAVGGVIGFTQFSYAEDTPGTRAGESGAGKVVGNNLTILTDTCVDSDLEAHDGFQKGNRCVSTEFGEVGAAANNPTLLITEAPRNVAPATPFTLRVSTRNLIRDRFLAAGQGGYYVESSVLQNGLVRGHFHTACRMLTSTDEAPESAPVPAFFVATEDRQGGADPDTVTIQVPGLPEEGTAQCSSWAGDGSHRIPMMERANQTPALDSVRITVRAAGGNNGGGNNGGGNNGGGNNGGGGNNNGGNNAGGGNTGGNNTNSGAVKPSKPAATKPAATATPKTTTSTPRPNTTTANSGSGNGGVSADGAGNGSNDDDSSSNENANQGTNDKDTTNEAGDAGSTGTDDTATDTDTESDAGSTGTADSEEATEATPEATTKAAKPKASKSAESTTTEDENGTGAGDDGAPDDIEYVPADTTQAEPPAAQESGPISLIANNIAWVGGGAVLLLVGLIAAALIRNRPRNTWR
ncbi:hypothetical protein AMIS_66510 [Actinoplanes missouriensis 431]|uniref:Uncharacterized protein n=1 Tax=Actinoplanes missouriensis (strain ATCC 14538 / DSM 43046 / CBS 188.64 / JCM 3121 / NBRC 102363 / NCIMB 12654 / NRRL B-3342 / UNCC 431) TaxID=512565 RepID=I0HFT4_ACTM4|nr:hypothetical protein AMIS_66510 [Actinoplanes missouriensis 431]